MDSQGCQVLSGEYVPQILHPDLLIIDLRFTQIFIVEVGETVTVTLKFGLMKKSS
jgi:hypothetical protein